MQAFKLYILSLAVVAIIVFFGMPSSGHKAEDHEVLLSTADHSKFLELQKEFKSGPEVTAACLECHTEASKQIMQTSHWTWVNKDAEDGKTLGKRENIINNFCIALPSNEPRCTSCHTGYGWKDKSFDFTDETLVDCLVCHDQTKKYKKFPVDAGHPNYVPKEWPKGSGKMWQPVDLAMVAQNVGKPDRDNCGVCHFFGGGGEGVKHGDMDATLSKPHKSLDVHMNVDGLDFNCTECHTTEHHQISGRRFTIPAFDERKFAIRGLESNLLACEACHTPAPHEEDKLNQHTDKVSCQACHIPTMARARPTKMWWDWSKAGEKTEDGKPIVKKEKVKGTPVMTYHTKKGEFIWVKDELPEYEWFNGKAEYLLMQDKIDDQTPGSKTGAYKGSFDNMDLSKPVVDINTFAGSYDDPKARIWPVKIHRGKQPYDTVNKTMVIPKLFGPKNTDAYWQKYDWSKSITAGMAYADLPYSGEYDFIQTAMRWPLSHMVAPKEDALTCIECHSNDGRLASLTGFYMPGRDSNKFVDGLGMLMIIGTLVATGIHGLLRIVLRKKS